MSRSTAARRRGPNGRFLSNCADATATEPQRAGSLFALSPEVRCLVYQALFSIVGNHTLRRLEDAKARKAPDLTLFDNAILRTCKTVCTEALPLFYASQKFHYSAELNGLLRQPNFLKAHAGWIKHLGIEVTVKAQSFAKLDAIIARHVEMLIKCCTRLSSFTLHVIPATEAGDGPPIYSQSHVPDTFTEGAAAKTLKTLRSRLQLLSIVTFGRLDDLNHFREAIAGGDEWVEGDKCYVWPELRLTGAQYAAVNVQTRRYTIVGRENVVHPHKVCIRVSKLYRSKTERDSIE